MRRNGGLTSDETRESTCLRVDAVPSLQSLSRVLAHEPCRRLKLTASIDVIGRVLMEICCGDFFVFLSGSLRPIAGYIVGSLEIGMLDRKTACHQASIEDLTIRPIYGQNFSHGPVPGGSLKRYPAE
jgi:hypothetical protein